jgi:hypothetical protein
MSRFSNALGALVKDLNQAYQSCFEDLKSVVGQVKDALTALSPSLDLRLVEEQRSADATSFQLVLSKRSPKNVASIVIGHFDVRVTGYPLLYSSVSAVRFTMDDSVLRIADKQALERHFEEMLNNKNSSLVSNVAFMLRE